MLRPYTSFIFFMLTAGWLLTASSLGAQTTSQTSFGKNRVQYHRQFDDWMTYETRHFITYWYGDARNVAQAAAQTAEWDFGELQQALEHQSLEKIEMLVFQDLTDLKQSNIGEEEVFLLKAGETKVIGNKAFIYFDGNHQHLRAQLREGAAGALLNSMLFGSNLQEIVQNAVLLNLPAWYTSGLMAWCGENWSVETDDRLRQLIQSGRYSNFERLAKDEPRLAGHAFWHYITLQFGRGTISNLLYLTRINRSIDAGFFYVLGNGYRSTADALMAYYQKRYADDAQISPRKKYLEKDFLRDRPGRSLSSIARKVIKRCVALYQVKISPDGMRLAWVVNDLGRWRIWMQDIETGRRYLLLKGGTRNALQATDYNYPLLAWHPDNRRLAVLHERRDVPKLTLIETDTRKKEKSNLSPEYQRVYSMEFANANELLLSAAVRGFSDLFLYKLTTRQTERLTQDHWDDLDATMVQDGARKYVMFASNRLKDSLLQERLDTLLPVGHMDMFLYDLENRDPELIRVMRSPLFEERRPVAVDSTHFGFLSDENGIINRFVGYLEPYTAYYETVIFLKNGAQVKASDSLLVGEWPLARVRGFLAPLDTVLKNTDSTQIDSIRVFAVSKKRPVVWQNSNYDRNIREQHASVRVRKGVETLPVDKGIRIVQRNFEYADRVITPVTRYREITLRDAGLPVPTVSFSSETAAPPRNETREKRDTMRELSPGWLFQVPPHLGVPPPVLTEISVPAPTVIAPGMTAPLQPDTLRQTTSRRPASHARLPATVSKKPEVARFNPSQIVPYRLKFRTDNFDISPNNELLFDGLQDFDRTGRGYRPPPMGLLMKAKFKDVLENYAVETGVRVPVNLSGAEYYIWMDNKKRRLDRRTALYRRTVSNTSDLPSSATQPPRRIQTRRTTLLGQYEVRYPLDVFTSLRGTFTVRQDRTDTLSTDLLSLEASPRDNQRAGLRLSAVYDNTVDVDFNIKTGTRAKVYVESVKKFAFNTRPDWSLKLNEGFMTIVGIDARHYHPLLNYSVLALRLAGATSFGSERMLYYLGNIDNPLLPNISTDNPDALLRGFNTDIPVPTNGNFAFEAPANNLRGFGLNIRNGTSYALLNSELRIPVFKYLMSHKPSLGSFWRNFQIVGFFDIGTAWQGRNPYRGDNPINIVPKNNPPTVYVNVKYFRDPLVVGYGAGVRMQLLGSFVRLDYARGVETRVIQKPMLHIGIGADF
jgi:hypothetical protein